MRNTTESRLANPALADVALHQRLQQTVHQAQPEAPLEGLDESLRGDVGSLHIDPTATLDARTFRRDLAAVYAMLPETVATHLHHRAFQWSYYYDAQQRW